MEKVERFLLRALPRAARVGAVKAARTKREAEVRSPGSPKPPAPNPYGARGMPQREAG